MVMAALDDVDGVDLHITQMFHRRSGRLRPLSERRRGVEPLRAQHRIMLRRAIDRGQLSASTDTEVALDLLYGSAYHRLLNGHQPLNDTFARHVVDIIVAGLGAVPAA